MGEKIKREFSKKITLGIDASNIRLGGGITHIKELLQNADLNSHAIERVFLWGAKNTTEQLPNYDWLEKRHSFFLEGGLLLRLFWQTFILSFSAKKMGCSILFILGGSFLGRFSPVVVISQNLIPFETREMMRYGVSVRFFKFFVLRVVQTISLRRADGVIFLTQYARKITTKVIGNIKNIDMTVIPHGISAVFNLNHLKDKKKLEKNLSNCPIEIIYVSNIDLYKHQDQVLRAVNLLRSRGYSVSIKFIGPSTKYSISRLSRLMKVYDSAGTWSSYCGQVNYEEMSNIYKNADIAVFASTCETFGITLLEKMASGLPIACSNMSCMPEILQDGGLYFNPEDPSSIADAVEQYLLNPNLKVEKSLRSIELTRNYSWEKCAQSTFSFLEKIAREYKK